MFGEISACQVCGENRFERLPRPNRWIGQEVFEPVAGSLGLSSCAACGFVFVNPRPSEELIQSFYRVDDYDCHEHEDGESAPWLRLDYVLDLLSRYSPQERAGHLLDFGCGGGYFVRRARERGWMATGYDIGDRARATCEAHGIPFAGDLEKLYGQPFDLITLHHVFEHIYDYPAFFEKLDQLAGEQTLVYIEVPNARSLRARLAAPLLSRRLPVDERYRAYPIHLSYFSVETLTRLLERFGYEVVDIHSFGLGLDEFFLMPRSRQEQNGRHGDDRGAAAPSAGGVTQGLAAKALKAAKGAVKSWLYNRKLGENLAIVARKRRTPAQAAVSQEPTVEGCRRPENQGRLEMKHRVQANGAGARCSAGSPPSSA